MKKAFIPFILLFILFIDGCSKQTDLTANWVGYYSEPLKNDSIRGMAVYKVDDNTVQMQWLLITDTFPDSAGHRLQTFAILNNVTLSSATSGVIDEYGLLVPGSTVQYRSTGSAQLDLNALTVSATYVDQSTSAAKTYVFSGTK
jgi:hypothetical protein